MCVCGSGTGAGSNRSFDGARGPLQAPRRHSWNVLEGRRTDAAGRKETDEQSLGDLQDAEDEEG